MRSAKLTFCLSLTLLTAALLAASGPTLSVYLPREITVDANELHLGDIAVLSGPEAVKKTASSIDMGKISLEGQKLVIDRNTILSRLASNGIHAPQITLKGAKQITVRRNEQTITSEQMIEKAADFLKSRSGNSAIHDFQAVRCKDSVVIPGKSDWVKLTCRPGKINTDTQKEVLVDIISDGQVAETVSLHLRPRYQRTRATASADIPSGRTLTSDNVKLETYYDNSPEPSNWTAPFGRITRKALKKGEHIRPGLITAPKPEVVIKRNQTLVIKIQTPALLITTMGKALDDGAVGETIKVRNIDSGRILTAQVGSDGTVSPVL